MSQHQNKRDRIYQAALKEFAEKGYEKASTNQMIQAAGISKGLLFHYFESKKKLFLSVYENCIEQMSKRTFEQLEELPTDLFDRLLLLGRVKMQLFAQYPLESQFLFQAMLEWPDELKNDLEQIKQSLSTDTYSILLKDLDLSNVRPELNQQKAVQTIIFILEAVSNQQLTMLRNQPETGLHEMDPIYRQMVQVCDMLKYGIYLPSKIESD